MLLNKHFNNLIRKRFLSADYLILGAGSAGCVLANRLTEDPNTTVTLIEAGRKDNNILDSWKIHMPSALTYNLDSNKYNWNYNTVPQKNLNNRVIHQPRGKVIGGSSSLNAMVYVRGHALDFERWSKEDGCLDWSYADCLPYFKKAQNHIESGDLYRGEKGPLDVCSKDSSKNKYGELFNIFQKAGIQSGYPYSEDLNGFQQEGFGKLDMTISPNGKRCSTSNAYLKPILNRPNLNIITQAHVQRIIMDNMTAKGIEITHNNNKHKIMANTEVISCLGSIGSPQLLMLSGIGPNKHLGDIGIKTILDSPEVGNNLQDHLEFYVQYLCKKPVTLYPLSTWKFPHLRIAAGLEWFLKGTGVCASNQFEIGAFIRSRAGIEYPDIQLHFIPGCVIGQKDFLQYHGFQVHCGTLRPTSRGTLRLKSSNPNDYPLINPNYLDTEEDLIDLINGLKLTKEIIEQNTFDDYRDKCISSVNIDNLVSCTNFIKQYSHSAYHPSSTCSMGKVVDSTGKVFGIDKLRIVDASIMPSLTSGNINAPVIMMAEKCADHIKNKKPLEKEHAKWFTNKEWKTQQR
jgi:choline dehydrogenase